MGNGDYYQGDFYEEDETLEEIQEAFRRGEKGVTCGPKHLDPHDAAIVQAAVLRIEANRFVGVPSGLRFNTGNASDTIVIEDCRFADGPEG